MACSNFFLLGIKWFLVLSGTQFWIFAMGEDLSVGVCLDSGTSGAESYPTGVLIWQQGLYLGVPEKILR